MRLTVHYVFLMSAANRMRSLPAAAKLLCVCFFKNFLEDKVATENANLGLAFSAGNMYLETAQRDRIERMEVGGLQGGEQLTFK